MCRGRAAQAGEVDDREQVGVEDGEVGEEVRHVVGDVGELRRELQRDLQVADGGRELVCNVLQRLARLKSRVRGQVRPGMRSGQAGYDGMQVYGGRQGRV